MAKPKKEFVVTGQTLGPEIAEDFLPPDGAGAVVDADFPEVGTDIDDTQELSTQDAAEQFLDEMAASSAVAAETMVGDLLGALVDEIRILQDPWQKTSEAKQAEVIDRLTRRVESVVKRAVHIIASDDRPTIRADLEQVTLKEGIKAVLTIRSDEPARHELYDATGQSVLVVIMNAEQYQGGKDQVKPDKDQPEIPLNTVE